MEGIKLLCKPCALILVGFAPPNPAAVLRDSAPEIYVLSYIEKHCLWRGNVKHEWLRTDVPPRRVQIFRVAKQLLRWLLHY